MSQQLREAENQVVVEGLFAENRLEDVEIDGMKVIRGEFDVEVAEGEIHTLTNHQNHLQYHIFHLT